LKSCKIYFDGTVIWTLAPCLPLDKLHYQFLDRMHN
jgi:hypothetical protein